MIHLEGADACPSGAHRGMLGRPRLGRFELGRKPQQQVFLSVGRHKMDADRQC